MFPIEIPSSLKQALEKEHLTLPELLCVYQTRPAPRPPEPVRKPKAIAVANHHKCEDCDRRPHLSPAWLLTLPAKADLFSSCIKRSFCGSIGEHCRRMKLMEIYLTRSLASNSNFKLASE